MSHSSPNETPGAGHLAGRNAVREILEESPENVSKLLLAENTSSAYAREIQKLAKSVRVPVQRVPARRIEKLVPGINHQGVVALRTAASYTDIHDLLTQAAPTTDEVQRRKPVILILDNIQDPFNLGAIIRSGAAAGAAGVILPARNAAPLNAAAMKTSAGAALRLPVARVPNLIPVLDEMKERGYWIAGADGSGEVSVWDMDWDRPLGIVIGSEEKGMRPAVAAMCDYRVSIPISGGVESLNASVAAGVILFIVSRGKLTPEPKKYTPR